MVLRNIVRRLGFDIVRYPYKYKRTKIDVINEWRNNRFKLIHHNSIDLILDVGASDGHFGAELRKNGYTGQIISFEPLSDAFLKLKERAKLDTSWLVFNHALGESNVNTEINIAGNSQSSSILEMGMLHQTSAPESRYIGRQNIEVKRLDDLFDAYSVFGNIYLKLDVQGYEDKVFHGVDKNLSKIKGIQLEMSLVELYNGEKTFFEQCDFLLERGFKLTSLEPGFYHPTTGQLLQVDGIWFR